MATGGSSDLAARERPERGAESPRVLRAEALMALALVVAGTLAPLLVLILADLESAGGLFVAVACTAGVIGVAALLYGLWLVARSGGIWSGWTGGRSWRASRSTESITARSRALLWLAVGVYLVVWQVGLFGVGFLLFFSDTR